MPCQYQASMQIIAVVAFGNGREAYPSQHKSQVRCPWDNLTWRMLLCPKNIRVSALRVSCSPILTGCACLLSPSCFSLGLKLLFHGVFPPLFRMVVIPVVGQGEGRVCCREPEISAGLPRSFAFAGCGHMRALRLWAEVVSHDAGTVCWQSLTADKLLCAATRIASALKTNFGIKRIEWKKKLQLEEGAVYHC